jgi:phosphohistidine swiveling domain-containing protein
MSDSPDIIENVYEPEDGSYPPDPTEHEEVALATRRRAAHSVPRGNSGRLQARERQRRALELRKAGLTYVQIAQQLGYSDHTGARQAVLKAFDEIIVEPTVDLRNLQYERLNHMLLVLWPKVQGGDERSIATALAIMKDMNALMGTEAPQEINVTHEGGVLVIEGNKDDFIAHMKKMAAVDEDAGQISHVPLGDPLPLPSGYVEVEDESDGIIEAEIIDIIPPPKRPRMKTLKKDQNGKQEV